MASEAPIGNTADFFSFRYRLRQGFRHYVLVKSHEPLPDSYKPVHFAGLGDMEMWLRGVVREHANQHVLRELLYNHGLSRAYGPVSVDELAQRVAAQLWEDRLRLAEAPPTRMRVIVPPHEEEEEAPAPAPVEEKYTFSLQVVDDATDQPISGIKLRIKLPTGSSQQSTTDGSGNIRVSNVPEGRIEVVSVIDGATLDETLAFVKSGAGSAPQKQGSASGQKPSGRFLARLIQHKVSDGETLESVAENYGLTKNQLAQFNWGTTDPKEIQKHLFLDVGCTMTDGGGKFVLSRHDDPGLLYIARPVELSLMASGPRQVLRVGKVPAPPAFVFSS